VSFEALDRSVYRDLVGDALAEDIGSGDITTAAIVPAVARVDAVILAKSQCVLAGLEVAREVFRQLDASIEVVALKKDGDRCAPGDHIAQLTGSAAAVLTAERTALNFLQYLSSIATRTREFVEAAGDRLAVLDTRKTTPSLRALIKYAVRCGGGLNHRFGLYDGVLIKDNHIRCAGGVAEAVRRVRASGTTLPIEVEAQNLAEVDDALAAGADIIMLDNLDDAMTRAAVERIGRRARVEVSGGMTPDRVRALASSGADYVSVGAITHSAAAVDMSLEVEGLLSLPDARSPAD
jgi:nicotinate-nucleotide pyrophosphorylase (carboxylating)